MWVSRGLSRGFGVRAPNGGHPITCWTGCLHSMLQKKGATIDAVIPTIKQMNNAALLQDPTCMSQNDTVRITIQDLIAF